MQVFLVIALIIAVIAVIFAVQNITPVVVAFFIWKFGGSLALVLLLAVVTGVLISMFASLPTFIRSKWAASNQKRKIKELEATVYELKVRAENAQNRIQELENARAAAAAPAPAPAVPPPGTPA
jgi:lipopolysaccharide assembly protein A